MNSKERRIDDEYSVGLRPSESGEGRRDVGCRSNGNGFQLNGELRRDLPEILENALMPRGIGIP